MNIEQRSSLTSIARATWGNWCSRQIEKLLPIISTFRFLRGCTVTVRTPSAANPATEAASAINIMTFFICLLVFFVFFVAKK